jgi:hypothetical protein
MYLQLGSWYDRGHEMSVLGWLLVDVLVSGGAAEAVA